jgi:hypothetical protein
MSIQLLHWEIVIQRESIQTRGKDKIRTVGRYGVFHNGVPTQLHGWTAESKGSSDNSKARNRKRIEARTYPLWTQDGEHYKTIGYNPKASTRYPRPGVLVGDTNKRSSILIHVGHGFLASVGCINLSAELKDGNTDIDFVDSRKRVIAMIEDMKSFLGAAFPKVNNELIPGAFLVIKEIE